tara:strand:- start:4003 stop:5751 length:1749 start_codon:yes stop_codon:yes gene_type:complete
MSTSFWKAQNTVPIIQTSSTAPVLNGLDFSAGQEVRIKVPPTTKFIQPRECYLQGDFKIQMPTSASGVTRLQLDPRLGGQALIRDIRIFSSPETGSVLLEEIQGYNSMVSVMRDYDTNDSEKKKRAMTEGATVWVPQTRGTLGTTRSECADTLTNPYSREVLVGGAGADASDKTQALANADYLTCKLCLPLETGIFRSERIWANMLTGLEIVITLEDADRCITQLDSVLRSRRLKLNPRFHSKNGSLTGPDNWVNGSATDTFYIEAKTNSNNTPSTCPLVVGERIAFSNPAGTAVTVMTGGPVIKEINVTANADTLQVKLDANASFVTPGGPVVAKEWFVYSTSVELSETYSPTYTFSNVELVVQEVDMGASYISDLMARMKQSGKIVNDILSVTNYRYSQAATDTVANIRLPLNNARGKSIVCVPTDATTYTSKARIACIDTYDIGSTEDVTLLASDQFRGISDSVTDYQFVYDGRLQPSRPVSTSKTSSKTSISAQPLIETTKALVQAEVNARSLADFNRNFVIGRALALNKGVYDTRNKDFNLQVNYNGSAPSKNKLWNNLVFHLRRIEVKGDNITVIV